MSENFQTHTASVESSNESFESQSAPPPQLLPRNGWKSQWGFLKVLYRTKKALDEAEKDANSIPPIPDRNS